jgi:hypothetical protein
MKKEKLYEMIDACRPGHLDVDEPEMELLASELARDDKIISAFKRSQQVDEVIGQAVRDVKVPDGAAERFLHALERRPSRRWNVKFMTAVVAIGTAAIIVAALCVPSVLRRPDRVDFASANRIADAVDLWENEMLGGAWQDPATAPIAVLPHSSRVPLPVSRWQWATDGIVCYELFHGDYHDVRLFVMRPSEPVDLGMSPPATSVASANWSTGAWQSGGRVYVLAVSLHGAPSSDLYQKVARKNLLSV